MNGKMLNMAMVLLLLSSTVVAHDTPPVVDQTAVENKEGVEADAFAKEWNALKGKKNIVGFARLNHEDSPQLIKTVREIATKLGIAVPPVFVFAGNPVHNTLSYVSGVDIRINAFAFALTTDFALIVVGDRLIEELSALQIRSIIAHELGHIARNHFWKRLLWKFGITGPVTAGVQKMMAMHLARLEVTRSISPATAAVILDATGKVTSATVSGLGSRMDEREADIVAVRATRDGKNLGDGLRGMERVFAHDHPVWGYIAFKIYMKYFWWMATHPRTEVRAAYANAEEARLKAQLI